MKKNNMTNTLFYGDNLEVLRGHIKSETIDLIYLDPPFNSKATYNVLFAEPDGDGGGAKSESQVEAFNDFWHWDTEAQKTYEYLTDSSNNIPDNITELIRSYYDFLGTARDTKGDLNAYIVMMTVRLLELHRVLKPTGSIYLHCDPTASHYLKLVLDSVFGAENFISEIVWAYGTASGGRTKGMKPVKGHDIIFAYAKKYGSHIYNRIFLPYSEKYISERFIYKDEDGRIYRTRKREGGKIERQYLDESKGVPLSDTWTDIKQLYAYHLLVTVQDLYGIEGTGDFRTFDKVSM